MPYENFCVICDEQGGVDICEYCHTNADWVHANFFGEVPFRRISHKSHEMKEHDFVPMKPPNTYDRKTGKSKYDSFKRAESFDAGRKLRKKSCCCGADIKNPCACMKDGVMTCRADEPKCPCYAAKTEVKEAVVFAPRKPTGIVDKVMMNHAMMQQVQLEGMIEYMENMIQLGLLSEEEVMAELHKTFGSEYYFDNSVEDIVMDEYLEDEDYDDAEIYARNVMKKLNASSSTQKFHPRQKGTCVACGGKFSWNQERCLDCGSGANLWSFDTETFGVEAWDLDITTKFWFCAACNDRYEDQNDAEECCLESSYIDERGFWNIIHAEDEPMWCACGCAGKIADHDDRGYGCWPCIDCGDDSDTDINEVCSSCVGQTFSAEELTTQYGDNQEQYFRDKFYESEKVAQEASDYPLNHLGFWFEMADEPYGGHIRDMLEKPWNWRQEMTRYLFEGGYEGVMYGDDEDLFALGFDASYPPYLTLKELGELYDWMPTYEDYKGYVHNFYRAEYQEVNKSPLGVIVKGKDGKTYVLVPQDLAEIIFQQSKYVLDAEWRKEELLYSDELNDMMPISVGTMMFDKIYVATRNEGEDIVTYIVQEELIDEEKLYRILVVIDGPLGSTHKKYLEAVMDEM